MLRPVWDLPLSSAGIKLDLDNELCVRIRPIRPDDRAGIHAAFERFSAESRYMRFFSARPQLGDDMAAALTDFDDAMQLAWAVFDPAVPSEVGDNSGLVIASARLFIDPSDAEPAEVGDGAVRSERTAEGTLAIVDDYQGRGLGRFLIELLVATAADNDIALIRFEVLHENRGMRALLNNIGAAAHRVEGDASVLEYQFVVPPVETIDLPAGALYTLLRRAP